jgi:3-dehydroquinate synthase
MNTSIERTFTVTYNHRLLFTQSLFTPNNPLFREVVAASRPGQRVRLLFVMDSGVAQCWPDLDTKITAYCEVYAEYLDFSAIVTVVGGEDAKNEDTALHKVIDAIESERICRHSLVVAIGGGAVIDMVGKEWHKCLREKEFYWNICRTTGYYK